VFRQAERKKPKKGKKTSDLIKVPRQFSDKITEQRLKVWLTNHLSSIQTVRRQGCAAENIMEDPHGFNHQSQHAGHDSRP
jgi:hypothetical protein